VSTGTAGSAVDAKSITPRTATGRTIELQHAWWQKILSASELVNDPATGDADCAHRCPHRRCGVPVSLNLVVVEKSR
jgi:hypothetical protein